MPKDAVAEMTAGFSPADRRRADRTAVARSADSAFRDADVRALKMAYYMRFFALGAIGIWLIFLLSFSTSLFYLALLVVFMGLGYAQYRAGKAGETTTLYALILLDFLFLAFTIVTDNPLSDAHFPAGQKVHQGREVYFFILLSGVSACFDPRRVLWAGACAIGAWCLGFFWLTTEPGVETVFTVEDPADLASWIKLTADPNFIDFNRLLESIVAMAIVTGIMAAVAYRLRMLVRSQIATTRERANLARYFAPSVVDGLARNDAPFDAVKAQSAVVMFVDVVGFTAMSENRPPEQVIGFLRQLHGRLEQAIFDHGGTLDKYMGDGVMAIFGAPAVGPDDACRAIEAARAMQASAEAWNAERRAAGEADVLLAIGVHYGPVVTGDIGSERRLEFATIGDAVNLASRLEVATRNLGASVVVSAATAAKAEAEDANRAQGLLTGFGYVDALELPGHTPVDVYALKRQELISG